MTLIKPNDSLRDCIIKVAAGNPGALMALASLSEVSASIDPDSAFSSFTAVVSFDGYGIYGTDVYVLQHDICDGNSALVLACLRAVQLGLLPEATLKAACARQDYGGRDTVPARAIYAKVKEELPSFDPDGIGLREGDGQ